MSDKPSILNSLPDYKPSADNPKCSTCRWWVSSKVQGYGNCHRNPPVWGNGDFDFVPARADDFCGEHSELNQVAITTSGYAAVEEIQPIGECQHEWATIEWPPLKFRYCIKCGIQEPK